MCLLHSPEGLSQAHMYASLSDKFHSSLQLRAVIFGTRKHSANESISLYYGKYRDVLDLLYDISIANMLQKSIFPQTQIKVSAEAKQKDPNKGSRRLD